MLIKSSTASLPHPPPPIYVTKKKREKTATANVLLFDKMLNLISLKNKVDVAKLTTLHAIQKIKKHCHDGTITFIARLHISDRICLITSHIRLLALANHCFGQFILKTLSPKKRTSSNIEKL